MKTFNSVVAVVLAAGRSTRMGGGENKVLRPLEGRPVLSYSLGAFQNSPLVSHVVVTGRTEDRSVIEQIIEEFCPKAKGNFTGGGAERFDSVKQGLEFSTAFRPDAVLIHDSARPFIEERFIIDSLNALQESPGSVIGIPLRDSLKETDASGLVIRTHERSRYWFSQTPQTFRFSDIYDAYCSCSPPPYPTDDGEVMELSGGKVKMVQGSPLNFKLTTQEDWMLAKAVAQARQKSNT